MLHCVIAGCEGGLQVSCTGASEMSCRQLALTGQWLKKQSQLKNLMCENKKGDIYVLSKCQDFYF